MRLYFEAAYIAKCYINEPDSKSVRKLGSGSGSSCPFPRTCCIGWRRAWEVFRAAYLSAQETPSIL